MDNQAESSVLGSKLRMCEGVVMAASKMADEFRVESYAPFFSTALVAAGCLTSLASVVENEGVYAPVQGEPLWEQVARIAGVLDGLERLAWDLGDESDDVRRIYSVVDTLRLARSELKDLVSSLEC